MMQELEDFSQRLKNFKKNSVNSNFKKKGK